MIEQYVIIILVIILIGIVLFKNKKNENKDSYDQLKHEGYNKDIKEDQIITWKDVDYSSDDPITLKDLELSQCISTTNSHP